ncbi:MAG: RHS repeat-associated core domain-containing protein [Gammaproteobacteria bacterium]|nr:RHS repeat-associated core domain-containing protein [Gammaproteobacteria bacterium]
MLTVTYEIDDAHGTMNPKAVSYDDAEVRFKYRPRNDLRSNTAGTGRVRRNSVLHTVEVHFDGAQVREYRLDSNTVAGRTRLEKVQECGYTEAGVLDACLPPLAFSWVTVAGAPTDFGIGVSKVTDGRGADTEFRYRAVSGSRHALNYTETPFGTLIAGSAAEAVKQVVVSEVRRDDGRGGNRSFHYRYKGAPQRSTLGRGYLGFPETRIRDVEAQTYSYRQTRMDWPFHGSTAAALVLNNAHGSHTRTYARAENAYAALAMHGDTVKYPYLARATRWIYEGNTVVGGSELVNALVQSGEFLTRRTSTSTTGNTVSNPAFTATVWGDVPNRAIGSVKQTVTTVENYTNTNTTTEWTIGKVNRRTVTHAASGETTRTVDTTHTYLAGTRNVDTTTRLPSHATLTLTTDRRFDTRGRVTRETVSGDGITSRTTTNGSYTESRYPSSVTNALYQTVNIVYDLRFGEPKQLTDPNSDVSRISYDAFGRRVRETAPDGTAMSTTYQRCGAAGVVCPNVPNAEEAVKVTTTVANGTTQTAPTRVAYLDVLGREVVSDEEAFDSTDGWRRQHREYDKQGRLKHVSRPYFSTGTAPRCATAGTCTSYHHDAVFTQRIVTRAGGGTVQTDRSGTAGTTTVDTTEQTVNPSATLRKRTKLDVLGRVVETVDDYGSNDAVTTTYGYDALGNLDKVVVDGVTTATMTYDEIGHRTTLTDASLGTWRYDYNALSELTSETDAKGQKTTYAYDLLGRPTQRRDCFSGCSPTVTNTWTWDPTNATGELASSTNGTFTETYTYRAADGKPTGVATRIAVTGVLTASYSRTLGYDAAGRPSTVRHPDGTTYTNTYTARGHPKAVKHGTTVLHEFKAADAFGNVTREEFNGNAFATVRTFDADTGRLTGIRTGTAAAPNSVQDLEYKWREDAVLHQRIDKRGTAATPDDLTDTFTMDGLSRTTRQATTGGATRTLDFAYDDRGNLTSKTSSVTGDLDATAYTYWTTGKPDRLTRATLDGVATTLSHDANGNVTGYDAATGDDTAVAYDGANRVVSITVGASASPTAKDEFWHRPDGSRFLRRETWKDGETSKSALTVHLGDYEETRPSAGSYSKIQRVRASPGVVRVRRTAAAGSSATSGSRFEYLHRDHLGSLDRVTDGAGAAAATLAAASFDAFGGRREADWSSDAGAATRANVLALQAERFGRGFGDHEELSRTGFVHMNGRVYDPRLGRFLQPDPVVAAPHSSQGHNRYAYVLNRPLSLADPTGLTPVPPGAMALGMSPVDINAVILANLWDYISWADVPVYQLSGFDSIIASGLSNAGLNTYLKTKITIEECLSGDCVEWITSVERAAQHAGRVPAWLWPSGYASHMVGPGFHVYAHTSSEICRADEPGCTLENIVDALNAVGVHKNQTRPFVPGEPYVGDVDLPPPIMGIDDVSTSAILDRSGRQIGVLNATLQNHALHPGWLRRGPVLIAGGYRIRTVSVGTGWLGFPNIVGGPVYWRGVDRRVIDRVRGRLRG